MWGRRPATGYRSRLRNATSTAATPATSAGESADTSEEEDPDEDEEEEEEEVRDDVHVCSGRVVAARCSALHLLVLLLGFGSRLSRELSMVTAWPHIHCAFLSSPHPMLACRHATVTPSM